MSHYDDEPTFEPGKTPATTKPGPQFPHPINPRYKCIELLGHGSGGAVYRAYDQQLQRDVAIKFIHLQNVIERRRLLAEGRVLAQLDHPHVCKVYEVVEDGDAVYLVMSFVNGSHLGEWRQQFSTEKQVQLIAQICDALAAAHDKEIVHCDVKPNNIVLKHSDSSALSAVLVDFGVAHSASLLSSQSGAGTQAYMAPERQQNGADNLHPTVDIYSTGATLLFLLTGQPTLQSLEQSDIADDLKRIIHACMRTDPTQRYQNMRTLSQDLQAWLNKRPISLRRSPVYKAHMGWRRNRWIRGTSAIAATVAVALFIGVSVYQDTMQQRQLEQLEIREQVSYSEARIDAIYRSPLHNTRPELHRLQQEAQQWQAEAVNQPDWLAASNYAAAGRIFLYLNENEKALESLTQAWQLGDHSGLTAMSLARVYKRLYAIAEAQARNLANAESRQNALDKAHLDYQAPALDYLDQAQDSSLPDAYVAAMRAFLQNEHQQALALLAADSYPYWFYQRFQLAMYIQQGIFNDASLGRNDHSIEHTLAEIEHTYQQLVARVPSHFDSHLKMGAVYNEMRGSDNNPSDEHVQKIKQKLDIMAVIDPTHPRLYHLSALIDRIQALQALQQLEDYETHFNRALRNNELSLREARERQWPEQHIVRLLTSTLNNLTSYSTALSNSNKSSASLRHRYFTLMQQVPEEHRGARHYMNLADNHFAMAYDYHYDERAQEHLKIGDQAYIKARQIAPTVAGMHANHARQLALWPFHSPRSEAINKLHAAQEAIDQSDEMAPGNSIILYNKGHIYRGLANNLKGAQAAAALQVALASYQRALDISPGLEYARQQIADIYLYDYPLLTSSPSRKERLTQVDNILQLERNDLPPFTLQRKAELLRFQLKTETENKQQHIARLVKVAEELQQTQSNHIFDIVANSLLATAGNLPAEEATPLTQHGLRLYDEYFNDSSSPDNPLMHTVVHVRAYFARWREVKTSAEVAGQYLARLEQLCEKSQQLVQQDKLDSRRRKEITSAWNSVNQQADISCELRSNDNTALTIYGGVHFAVLNLVNTEPVIPGLF
ncbi:hypothetical protein CWE09_10645 [Aliidiomarina minuta]|uniref:Protein kinase domain-containing protein n=1 Tax=Aliidiomarina minuta TaxID=880057 RepID=A0A432W4B5_9GAMM|nr:serine/threonine-protein kinase [Aliidiomarina minuta]RUO24326.1 hypothetical protein CWE09_10645 [Aliidiomarina minuta]